MTDAVKAVRSLSGKVVSNRGDKTISVLIERFEKHPLYGKYVKRSSKIAAHDENNDCKRGNKNPVRRIRCMYSTKQCICTNVIFNSSYANSYLNIHRDDLKMRKVYNMKIHRNFSASY